MVSPVLFWVVAILTVVPALSLLFARKAVHIAMSIVCVMVGLAAAYVGLDAPFLGVVQIVVYTGAVMMLFLFVLMLVGVDQREDTRETIKGQRWIAFFTAGGIAFLLISVLGRVSIAPQAARVGNPEEIALVLFGRYVLVMEVLGALLITAAVGALIMTHTPRLTPRRTQSEVQAARVLAGADPVNKPMPGVFARHNALDVPARDPEGKPIEHSVSRVLEARHQMSDGDEFRTRLENTSNPEDSQLPNGAPSADSDERTPRIGEEDQK
ncbi:NADH-quinone oxidoreductase subunit J [Demequina activiva]|uniref:NADH-quinone oxidoreductase subunit J n=1 Tax=Demequina activiva TaxID=1582364 RepID=A0A919Q604_9MICO|nr:NADH-quinone oxidoreductase subunit J [Demequina activiva]GIG54888.1 NADH:ubiquinone oxidoreductase subunit J [Demequina activiva]